MRRFVVLAALVQLAVQLLVLPDLWEPPTGRLLTWLALEAVAAVVIGIVAGTWLLARAAVLGGWLLQIGWFVVATPKDEDHNLWGAGIVVLGFCCFAALVLALLARRLTRPVRPGAGG